MVLLLWSSVLPTIFGFFLISFLDKKGFLNLIQKTALSFFLGTGIFTMSLFILSLVGLRWDTLLINLFFGVASLILFRLTFITTKAQKSGRFNEVNFLLHDKPPLINIILISLIVFKIFTIFYLALDKPVYNFDAWANWALRAKVFYFEGGVNFDKTSQYYLGGGGHINYPLHLPILQAWVYTSIGEWDDQVVKIISPLYLLFFTLFLYSFLSKFIGSTKSLFFAFIFISMPFMAYHASADYADLPLGLFIGLSGMLYFLFLKKEENTYLVLSSLMFGLAGWVKNEGFLLFVLTIILLWGGFMLRRLKTKASFNILKNEHLISSLSGVIFLLPWIIFRWSSNLGLTNLGSNQNSFNLSSHLQIGQLIANGFLTTSDFGMLWLAFILCLIIFRERIKNLGIFFLLTFIYLLTFILIYLFTPNYEFILSGTIMQRNLLILAPSVFWLIALMINETKDA